MYGARQHPDSLGHGQVGCQAGGQLSVVTARGCSAPYPTTVDLYSLLLRTIVNFCHKTGQEDEERPESAEGVEAGVDGVYEAHSRSSKCVGHFEVLNGASTVFV